MAIRDRDTAATIFLCVLGKRFGFFALRRVEAVARRQNIEIKELAGKILRNKELHG